MISQDESATWKPLQGNDNINGLANLIYKNDEHFSKLRQNELYVFETCFDVIYLSAHHFCNRLDTLNV